MQDAPFTRLSLLNKQFIAEQLITLLIMAGLNFKP